MKLLNLNGTELIGGPLLAAPVLLILLLPCSEISG
jgi:hypothetical protein